MPSSGTMRSEHAPVELPPAASRAESVAWLRRHPLLRQPLIRPQGMLATGTDLDALLGGGLPRGAVSEIAGRKGHGRTSLALAIAAHCSIQGELVAWLDTDDALDVLGMSHAGVVSSRLLWVRPSGAAPVRASRAAASARRGGALEQTLRAADIVAQAGGFGVVVVDLGELPHERRLASQPAVWVRLARRIEGTPTAMLVVGPAGVVGSVASVRIVCRQAQRGIIAEIDKCRHRFARGAALLQLGPAVD